MLGRKVVVQLRIVAYLTPDAQVLGANSRRATGVARIGPVSEVEKQVKC